MILVLGRPDDPPTSLTIAALQAHGADYAFLDDRYPEHGDMVVGIGSGGPDGRLLASKREIPLPTIGAIFVRMLGGPPPGDPAMAVRAQGLYETFLEWLDLTPALVVNRPRAMASNTSKPYQAQLIARAGFAVPATIVTNDPAEVEAFRRAHGRVVFKSISGVRSIVEELREHHAPRLERVRDLPTQFQAWVPGTDVRVHVVGEEVFATEIVTEATDYRYAARSGHAVQLRAIELDSATRERCVALARSLSLPLCGIDFRREPAGNWVCFEANSMPAYSYFQKETGAPIADAIARLLMQHAAPRREVAAKFL